MSQIKNKNTDNIIVESKNKSIRDLATENKKISQWRESPLRGSQWRGSPLRESPWQGYESADLWKCRIYWIDVADVVVPYQTDGKARCARLELIEII